MDNVENTKVFSGYFSVVCMGRSTKMPGCYQGGKTWVLTPIDVPSRSASLSPWSSPGAGGHKGQYSIVPRFEYCHRGRPPARAATRAPSPQPLLPNHIMAI